MKNSILIAYQFATFGGVERVLLNRAEAFKHYKLNYKLYVYFYKDAGAKQSLKEYIVFNNLNDYIEIVDTFDIKQYDYVVSIDTPKILKHTGLDLAQTTIETHTAERRNRTYLDKYINSVRKIVVPSNIFSDRIGEEYKNIGSDQLRVLTNFVPWEITVRTQEWAQLPKWNKNIIFYFGRVDLNKNLKEAVRSLKYYLENYDDNLLLVIVGHVDPGYNFFNYIKSERLEENVVLLPPVNFDKVNLLLNTFRENKAVFITTSKAETFSLSAAEAIAYNIPVVLSNIPAHMELVQGNSDFIYSLGDEKQLADKINTVINNYDRFSENIADYKKGFSAEAFIKDWLEVFPDKHGN